MATVNGFPSKQHSEFYGSDPGWNGSLRACDGIQYHNPRKWDSHQVFMEPSIEYFRDDYLPRLSPIIHDSRYEPFDMSYHKEPWIEYPRSSTSSPTFLYGDEHILPVNPGGTSASSSKSERLFDCHYCSKTFQKKADRDRHEGSIHRHCMPDAERPVLYHCPEKDCRRRGGFTRRDNLLDHRRRVHKADIPKRKLRV
ncbi:hypothetical protein BZA77DRAFT_316135 [Pyronema omphalodes]|nr:hypothetical protein BZA77DRAFT_316135 [Pyronema omphalodes]